MGLSGFNRMRERRLRYGQAEQRNTERQETQTEQTKKEIMSLLDKKGIEYNPRDKKEVLLVLLGGD